MEDKGDKPTVPFRAREGRVKVAVFVLGLVLLFIGLIGSLYGWCVASGLEATPPSRAREWSAGALSGLVRGAPVLGVDLSDPRLRDGGPLPGRHRLVRGRRGHERSPAGADDDDDSSAGPCAWGAPHLQELWTVHALHGSVLSQLRNVAVIVDSRRRRRRRGRERHRTPGGHRFLLAADFSDHEGRRLRPPRDLVLPWAEGELRE